MDDESIFAMLKRLKGEEKWTKSTPSECHGGVFNVKKRQQSSMPYAFSTPEAHRMLQDRAI